MARPVFRPALIILLLLSLVPAVSATVVLSDVAFTPNPPLEPGKSLDVVARNAIIPSGSTTFAPGHQLQMQTGMDEAKWAIQVTLDGRNAAYLAKSGSVAFVNGELLSYSTNHDVGMVVTVDGIVPSGTAGTLMVLQVDEIDNSGRIVPGSTLTIRQPVAAQTPAGLLSAVPTLTPSRAPAETPPMRAPGFGTVSGTLSCLLAAAFLLRFRA